MRCAEQTLAKYATQGCGPEFRRYVRDVVYAVDKLDEWALSRLSKPLRSTSQTDTPAKPGAAATQSVSDAGDRSAVPEASATPVEASSHSATSSLPARAEGVPRKPTKRRKGTKGGILDAVTQNPEK
jgi:hypothetical protein